MKKISQLIVLMLLTMSLASSSCMKQFKNDNIYLLSSKIVDSLEKFKGIEPQQEAGLHYSNIGNYKKALGIFGNIFGKTQLITATDSLFISNFKAISAKNYIIDQARLNRIVIINEAHHQPLHRVFATQLLKDLYILGYRYLAMEALNEKDILLNNRKYPIQDRRQSSYINDPQMGNLIREALHLGFTLVPYDFYENNNFETLDANQAMNIKHVFDKDIYAKMLIYCGYDHVFECEETSIGKPMAQYLKEMTGINPLTIDQVEMSEKSEAIFESPFLRLAKMEKASVYVDNFGAVFNGRKGQNKVDIKVFHPHTTYYYTRPEWLLNDQFKKWYFFPIQQIKIAFPVLIQAHKNGENASATPIDVVEIMSPKAIKPMALYNGVYDLRIINAQNEWQIFKINVQ
jgi:hypothetical protein